MSITAKLRRGKNKASSLEKPNYIFYTSNFTCSVMITLVPF
jgi:hypothetical protein